MMNRLRSLRRSPDDPPLQPPAPTQPIPPAPAPAPARSPSPLDKDPITVEQAAALQCADALQEIYLIAASTIPVTSPLHQRAERARALLLEHARLSPGAYPEIVRPWMHLPAPGTPAAAGPVQSEPKKEKRSYFLG